MKVRFRRAKMISNGIAEGHSSMTTSAGLLISVAVASAVMAASVKAGELVARTSTPGCQYWADSDSPPLVAILRADNGHAIGIKAPCGDYGSSAVVYNSFKSGPSQITMRSETHQNACTFNYDGSQFQLGQCRPLGGPKPSSKRR